MKVNCWEHKNCGREEGGVKVAEFGVCPAFTETRINGVNGGINAGRACWAVTGSFCGGAIQGTFAEKFTNCIKCDFYGIVRNEEGADYIRSNEIVAKIDMN